MSQLAQAKLWAKDATEKLHIAERAGEHANSLLVHTQEGLARGDNDLDRCVFILDATQGQLSLLDTVRASLKAVRANTTTKFNDVSGMVESALDDVESVFAQLKDVTVDPSLGPRQERGRARNVTLYDFVSSEILDVLRDSQAGLDRAYNALELEVDEHERMMLQKTKQFTQDLAVLEEEITKVSESEEKWIGEMLSEIHGLEEEIAGLLESITAHYDQCLRGVEVAEGRITRITQQEKTELFAVLEKDFSEVPDVLTDLEEALGDIQQRCTKIEEHFAGQGTLLTRMRGFMSHLTEYGEKSLMETLQMTRKHTKHFESAIQLVHESCDEARELVSHYHHFSRSYYALLVEVDRRRATQSSMLKLMEETQRKLESLQDDDFRHRESFLKANGAFLPNDIWNGFGKDDPLYHLDFKII